MRYYICFRGFQVIYFLRKIIYINVNTSAKLQNYSNSRKILFLKKLSHFFAHTILSHNFDRNSKKKNKKRRAVLVKCHQKIIYHAGFLLVPYLRLLCYSLQTETQ